ncbi:MAG: ATP synthase F1 subunit delta [Chthonomonadales bacterium]
MSGRADARAGRRYAAALFNTALAHGAAEAVREDLRQLASLWASMPLLRRSLESPLMPAARKREVVDQVLAPRLHELTVRFLHLLIGKRREEILPDVQRTYDRMADLQQGIVRAEAVTAVELDDVQRAALVEALERRTGRNVDLTVRVDPAIIGGVVVQLEDTVIDGSVRGALERLREQMLGEE